MDATKLDYTLAIPQSSRYTQTSMVKNQERQIHFSVSAVSSQLETNCFDLARNFGPLPVAQLTEAPYPYPRPCDIVLSPDQHRGPFPQEAPLPDVTTYIYDSGSSSYPSNPQPSQSPYHLSSGHEAFHDLHEDLTSQSVSLSINSSFDLAIQSPPPTLSSVPSNYSAVRRYHQNQSRQHAQVLHQLTQSRDGRRQPPTEHATENAVLSSSLEITPTGRRAELYHAASSIPMSNIRHHQPRPPEHAIQSHQLQHSHQSKPFNQYQYPYYQNQDLGYPENCRSEPIDGSIAHVLTTQDLSIYESAQQAPTSMFLESAKAMHIPSPSITDSATIPLESNVYTMRSGPRSNAIQSISQPSTHSVEGTTGASKVHPTTSISDVASITSPLPVLTNGTGHEDAPSRIAEEESNLIEIESENGDEEELANERTPLKEEGMENVVSNFPGTSAKRRDRKQSEGSGATGRRRTGDSKSDSVIKDGLSPPTKKRKKSKMHECQVCHKNFPRPSGLKTHMNTHNNERPYPCPYPGCNRSFGVRSNAKRHLRTHGVIPPQSTGTQPYVVDFSTPMVLEQDIRLGLNDGEGTDSNLSRDDDDDARPEGVPHTQRPARPGRGRGRQFKLRWMPPTSSTKSAVAKGRGKKKPTGLSSVEPVEPKDVDVKPYFSRSSGQKSVFLGLGDEDQDGEDADGEEDAEMDFGDGGDDQDEESEAEEIDRGEEEFGASTAMRTGVARFRPGSSQHSQASSSRTSLSSSLSGSTSATSLPLSAPSLPCL